jgi:MFS superfamily sulfate permease-like transporter
MSIGYGFVAFGQLGPELGARAALLGICCAILAGFFASLLGGSPIQITGLKAPLTLVMASVIAGLLSNAHIPPSSPSTHMIVLGLASACVLIAGLSQILTGFLGFGRLLRYVPQPVIAGLRQAPAAETPARDWSLKSIPPLRKNLPTIGPRNDLP